MLHLLIAALAGVWLQTAAPASQVRSRPADIAFRVQMIDPGFSESVAVADFNKDGRRDILSAEYWYEAPSWTKHKIRDIAVQRQLHRQLQRPAGRRRRRRLHRHHPDRLLRAADRVAEESGQGRRAWVADRDRRRSVPPSSRFSSILNNDGRAAEILPQFTGAAKSPLTWYELVGGKWQKHVVSSQSYGHGIGAGDVNGDKRNDIITPAGWLEAPADVRAAGEWTLHATNWSSRIGAAAGRALRAGFAAPRLVDANARRRHAGLRAQPALPSRGIRLHVRRRRQQGRTQRHPDVHGAQLWRAVVRAARGRAVDSAHHRRHLGQCALHGNGRPEPRRPAGLDCREALLGQERHRRRRTRADGHLLVRVPPGTQRHRRMDPAHRRLRRPRRRRTSDGGRRHGRRRRPRHRHTGEDGVVSVGESEPR